MCVDLQSAEPCNGGMAGIPVRQRKSVPRLPIGQRSVIAAVDAATVRAFYDRWYHPSRMAVVAVGDFVPEDVVRAIAKAFSTESPSRQPAEKGPGQFPGHSELRVSVTEDPEAMQTEAVLDCKTEARSLTTVGDLRDDLVMRLFHGAIGQRLHRLSMGPDSSFASAHTSTANHTRTIQSYELVVVAAEGKVLDSLQSAVAEIARVQFHGFTKEEVRATKATLLADLQTCLAEKDQCKSSFWCDQLQRHFLSHDLLSMMSVEHEVALSRRLLDEIMCDEVSVCSRRYTWPQNCMIKITRPARRGLASLSSRLLPLGTRPDTTPESLAQLLARATAAGASSKWSPTELPKELIRDLPPPGHIVVRRDIGTNPDVAQPQELPAVTELELSNGAKICLRHTTFLNDDVQVEVAARGGLSEALQSPGLRAAVHAKTLANELGPFGIPPETLYEMMSGKRVELHTQINTYNRILSGNCSPEDIETALQLVHLLFVSWLQVDMQRLEMVRRLMSEAAANREHDPMTVYQNRACEVNTNGSLLYRSMTRKEVEEVDCSSSCGFFDRCFAAPSEFFFTFVGNFDLPSLLPLLEKYIDSIHCDTELVLNFTPADVQMPQQSVRVALRPDGRANRQRTPQCSVPSD
eukprot:NODE_50_length_2943_cov_65.793366_g46_i0.p1 GENE.NODE_50_length_2943_cov_65.793366_g46_i0~~NODE_50_length_2943_cov_65.793366_g46_i0.p1  ORF type:complete len:635 (+),score=138.82 NODE_50_length_2943_cov_65.793366_g46_i0:345-2249(+)